MATFWKDIRITRVIDEELSDSDLHVLHDVELELSMPPPGEWVDAFLAAWERPGRFTKGYRPGMCRVVGATVVLSDSTVAEVVDLHIATLQSCMRSANAACRAQLSE